MNQNLFQTQIDNSELFVYLLLVYFIEFKCSVYNSMPYGSYGPANYCVLLQKDCLFLLFVTYSVHLSSNNYLIQVTVPDETIHLLYSANRWEYNSWIRNNLQNCCSIILDRCGYFYRDFNIMPHTKTKTILYV